MTILGKYMKIKSTYQVHGGHGTADVERYIFHDEVYTSLQQCTRK